MKMEYEDISQVYLISWQRYIYMYIVYQYMGGGA